MRVLVTGGNGFLGRAIVEELVARGHEVTSGARRAQPEIEALGARAVQLDLAELDSVRNAVAGHDAVVHAAALTGVWGPRAAFVETNVLGTRRVLQACVEQGVARLVYTGSPSACFDGRDHVDASNDLKYARRFLSPYPETKALAEAEVLAANGRLGLLTCALRPHLIVGARDPHLVPRLLARARAGRLRIVGRGDNEVSLCHVRNAAVAHALALERLDASARHAGRAYFVVQREPVRLWPWIARLCSAVGAPGPRGRVPLGVAYAAGGACELAWKVARRASEPPMTRFVALQLARSHSYSLAPARADFGYEEVVSLEEATAELARAFAR
ncbi:MAG: NAD-dependent epimerase/dehydratase family protein [Planctomycetota bacterium]|nr:MAG: NAD-dependent epimerase/dehydratase family protein [Planctomycetota bacterium]